MITKIFGESGKRKGAGWIFRTLFILAIIGSGVVTLIGAVAFWHLSRGLPQLISASDYRPLGVTRVFANTGKEDAVIGEFYKERRYLVPYDKIPETVVRAFVSAEDELFFEHQGVNLVSILRAAVVNFKAGHTVQGGSTITQQVVKSLLLTPEKSFIRKIKEVVLAGRIEKNLTKQQILYLYLNQIYLGHGNYGVQAAAKSYFRKDVSALTVAEAALLAGLPQAPGKYSPHLNPKRAKERQIYVLRRMYESKYITQSQMSDAVAQPLRIYQDEDINAKTGPYFIEHIRRYLVEKYGEKALYEDGLTIVVPTTIELMTAARNGLQEGLRQVDKRNGYRGPSKTFTDAPSLEKYLKDERVKLILQKIQWESLLPDGRLDAVEAMKASGIQSDAQLLDAGNIYNAVVTNIDEKRKAAFVMIGAVRAELPFDNFKWAKPATLKKGDLILVRAEKVVGTNVVVSLEQVPQVNGALLSIEAQTGNILAMEGGYDFATSEFNRAVQAYRQPGSAFKAMIYALAVERGYTPASIIVDSPIVYGDAETGKWKPSNYEERFYGDTTFRVALIKSRNVPTIKIVQDVQVSSVIDFVKRIDMVGTFPSDLSISLGSAAVSLYEMTKAYALFPRLGRKISPIFILSVKDRDGKILEENKPMPAPIMTVAPEPQASASALPVLPSYPLESDRDQVMDPRVAYVMTHLMKEVVSFGTGYQAKSLGRVAAGKTGTSNDSVDAWFMGFTPSVVTGVWVGFDNQKSLGGGETGAKAALPIWLSFMKEAVKGYPDADFVVPQGVSFVSIDPVSGKRAAPNSSNSIKEAFISGSEPQEIAPTKAAGRESQSDFFKEDID